MDTNKYLDRIGYKGDTSVCLSTLKALTAAHLHAVPFENLDIHFRANTSLERDWLYDKVVTRNRGGWCYELNLLYRELLKELGFNVEIHGGQVFTASNDGHYLEHLTLSVRLGSRRYLVDVGFGDGMYEPLELVNGAMARFGLYEFRVRIGEDQIHILCFRDGAFRKGLSLDLIPRAVSEFCEAVKFNSSNPASWWTQALVVSKAIPGGRSTVVGQVHTIRTKSTNKSVVLTRSEYLQILKSEFGIHISKIPRPRASSITMRLRRLIQVARHKFRRTRMNRITN